MSEITEQDIENGIITLESSINEIVRMEHLTKTFGVSLNRESSPHVASKLINYLKANKDDILETLNYDEI